MLITSPFVVLHWFQKFYSYLRKYHLNILWSCGVIRQSVLSWCYVPADIHQWHDVYGSKWFWNCVLVGFLHFSTQSQWDHAERAGLKLFSLSCRSKCRKVCAGLNTSESDLNRLSGTFQLWLIYDSVTMWCSFIKSLSVKDGGVK